MGSDRIRIQGNVVHGPMTTGTVYGDVGSHNVTFAPDSSAGARGEQGGSGARTALDVLVVTVKRVEFDAARVALGLDPTAKPLAVSGPDDIWRVDVGSRAVGLASIGMDGNVESAMKVTSLLRAVEAPLIVLVGMAAGVRDATRCGDVVVAESVWATDFVVTRIGENIPRPKTYAPRTSAWSRLATMGQSRPRWAAQVRGEVADLAERGVSDHEIARYEIDPRVHTGVVFAGSRLIEDGSLPPQRESTHGRLVAGEMEGAGFAAAASEEHGVDWLVVRGVADHGEPNRTWTWQFTSTYAAAALVRDGVRHGFLGARGAS